MALTMKNRICGGGFQNDPLVELELEDLFTTMTRNQEATLAVLKELSVNVAKMASSSSSISIENDEDSSSSQEEESSQSESQPNVERCTVRLDGLEVYAVVSALTCATLYQCFESFESVDWILLYKEWRFVELVVDAIFLASSATGIICGLHSTLVFSLMTMYGRTAIGMGRDDAFLTFFQNTGKQRFRGFQTFLWSLYSFLVQVVITIASKAPGQNNTTAVIILVAILYSMSIVYTDTQTIIEEAGIIFLPKTTKTTSTTSTTSTAKRKAKTH
jgi:hypothetical protein